MFIVIVKEKSFSNSEKYADSTLNYGQFNTIEEADEFVDKMIKIKIKKYKREKIRPNKPVVRRGVCKGKNVAMLLLMSKKQENIDRVVITFRRMETRLIERK